MVTQNVTVSRDSQTINFPSVPNQSNSSGTLQLDATSSSGLTVTYTSQTPSVCSVSGTTVTLLAAGTCTLVAMQSGDGTYASATPVTLSFEIGDSHPVDGPLPPWSLLLLALMFVGVAMKQMRRANSAVGEYR
jgi:hypothetical protein